MLRAYPHENLFLQRALRGGDWPGGGGHAHSYSIVLQPDQFVSSFPQTYVFPVTLHEIV